MTILTSRAPRRFLRSLRRWSVLLAGLAATLTARADVTLPAIFSDHAVLQRAARVPLWGTASPGEKVTVTLGSLHADTQADSAGQWRVELALTDSPSIPQSLIVAGNNRLVIADVLVGEVWLCSGQSNMAFLLRSATGGADEIAQSANSQLRQFLVKKIASPQPTSTLEGEWMIAGPKTSGEFTAVGYYFGKNLQQTLKQPVGLINNSWGGTPAEAWMSDTALDQDASLKSAKERSLQHLAAFPELQAAYVKAYAAWAESNQRIDHPADPAAFVAPSADVTAWKKITLTKAEAATALTTEPGAVWLRRTVEISPRLANKELTLDFPVLQDFDEVYWNGLRIGGTGPADKGANDPRRYNVPRQQVTAGTATLAVRVFNPRSAARIDLGGSPLRAGDVALTGDWLVKVESVLPALAKPARTTAPEAPHKPAGGSRQPSYLFNGMINPLLPYAVRGVVWYQGENNVVRGFEYRTTLKLLIEDWRSHWKQESLPFYICQLPNFGGKRAEPSESTWADLRESQSLALRLPDIGLAVLIDLGEQGDIHPRNKQDPGERVARAILAKTYGKPVAGSGPVYSDTKSEPSALRIRFSHTDGGLVARPLPATYRLRSTDAEPVPLVLPRPGSPLQGFQICGQDRQWVWADARIEKDDTVLVSSPDVKTPVAVRYAWAGNPTCNLYNGAGLPAAPFRTDSFPLAQQPE